MKLQKNKLLKILLLLAIVAMVGYYYVATHRAYYITNYDGSAKFRIPDEIIRSKDCTKYQEFVHSLAAPTFVPSDKCPWKWDKVTSVAHFTMNGVKFEVPREYLSSGVGQPDGETTSIHIQVKYPEMNPYHPRFGGKETIHDDVSFSIRSSGTSSTDMSGAQIVKNDAMCKNPITENCKNIGQYYFDDKIKYIPQLEYGKGYDPLKPLKIEDMPDGTSLYNYNYNYKKGYGYEYYIKGNPLKPDYWVECVASLRPEEISEGPMRKPYCEGVFNWNKEFYISYRFPREKLLSEQLEIKKKIEEKVKEFIVK